MTRRSPPRNVPTLTEVVQSAASPAPAVPEPSLNEEQLVQRVMQRVDLSLDKKIREAIATLVLEQSELMVPLLRQRLEAVVRQTVAQAVAHESFARSQPKGPKKT